VEDWIFVDCVGGGAEVCVGAVSWGMNCGFEMGGVFVEEVLRTRMGSNN